MMQTYMDPRLLQGIITQNNGNIVYLQRRREQVESTIYTLNHAFSDNVEDINKKISASINAILGGVTGVVQISSAAAELSQKREWYEDNNLCECKYQLNAELQRIDEKISSLRSQNIRFEAEIEKIEKADAAM